MARKKIKLFVVDTNVILHDCSCVYQFHEHDVVIPITVLEELDKFKKGNETLNYHAREFLRALDALSGDKLFGDGIKIGPSQGNIMVKLEREFHKDLAFSFDKQNLDHRILNTAYYLSKDNPARTVILVSKDVNLRMKAKAVGLMAEDYTTDHVKDISTLYTGYRAMENIDPGVIDEIYKEPYSLDPKKLKLSRPLVPNEYLILRNGKKSALARFNPATNKVHHIAKPSAYGVTPRNAEQTFAIDALLNSTINLVTISGRSGTGKTLLALAAALENRKSHRQIYLARPVVPLSNKDIGFLPGDIHEKLDPYMQPLYDNLGVIQNKFMESDNNYRQIEQLLDKERLVIAPLAYIRGRSLVDIFFIVDEAQNLTPHEIKTIITRAGENTKLVFTGDIFQIDHPYLDICSNGLSYLIDKMQGQKIYAHVNLERGERSELAELASTLL